MDEFDLPLPEEYDDIDRYEDQFADDLEALNDLDHEDFPVVKSRTSKLKESVSNTKSKEINGIENSFQILSSKSNLRIEEVDDEEFFESLIPSHPKSKRQKIAEESQDEEDFVESETYADAIVPELQRFSKPKRKFAHSIPPFGKDHVTVTDTEGRRVFISIAKSHEEASSTDKPRINSLNLLSTPFEDLRQSVDDKRHADLMRRANEIRDLARHDIDDEIFGMSENTEEVPETNEISEPEAALWVEKFTPKRFTELLSDDGINRILLKWLKLWDEFVFGKKKKIIKKVKQEKQNDIQKKFGKRKQNWEYEEELDLDHTGRPKFKIALLAGNPGLGKTTLAHVVAKHAGYNAVEMNASDDRSAELFRNKLETTTQMKACMGDGNKPNCLIIDEIDGAPLQAINILLQAVKETEETTAKKKKSTLTVTRPIICICNDLYVPALRPLRQIALTLSVPQITPGRLAQRLLEISRKQKMKADMACLLALCDKSENDIRSCVNTLQFVFKKHGELKVEHLQDISIGQKDFQKGLFFIWKAIFQLPRPSRKHFAFLHNLKKTDASRNNLALSKVQSEAGSSTMQTSSSVRFHNILHLASSNSEFEKMSQGLFDNYLNVKSKDPHLDTVVSCTDWLEFGDHLETKIRTTQNYSYMKFYPFLSVAFHMSLAGALAPKLTYSNSAIEFNTRISRSKQTLEAVVNDVKPAVRKNVGGMCSIVDLYPYLYEIIHPILRPVNIQLYSQSEKDQLLNLILTMISYNLTYHQERNADGQYTYVLQPNILEITAFPNLPQHKQLSYAAKQLVQREIDLEKMRNIENSLQKMDIGKESRSEKSKEKTSTANKNPAKGVQKMQPLAIKAVKSKPVLDFFGREITPAKESDQPKEKKTSLINTKVWFKFNEGYSNAVRRTARVQDFM